jgi:hypothetical protein
VPAHSLNQGHDFVRLNEIEHQRGAVKFGSDVQHPLILKANSQTLGVRWILLEVLRVGDVEAVAMGYSVAEVADHFEARSAFEIPVSVQRITKRDEGAREPNHVEVVYRSLEQMQAEVVFNDDSSTVVVDLADGHQLPWLDRWQ